MNKNALKIEKQLLNLFNLDETSSDGSETDESVTKKIKVNGDGITPVKQIGYVKFLTSISKTLFRKVMSY